MKQHEQVNPSVVVSLLRASGVFLRWLQGFRPPGSHMPGLLLRVVGRHLLGAVGIAVITLIFLLAFGLPAAIGSPFKPVENYHYSGEL